MTTYQTELIGGDGNFNVGGLEKFIMDVNLGQYGLSYAVVSIMGPQSSGKSTLLNKLFETKFQELDASKGRRQTTRGVWLSNYSTTEQCTLVMDLEGTDGTERAEEDNTSFEKQSALFALAISDIVLINIWCTDIGREQAANKPLLKTVFQVMLRLFNPRKITLMFVIRDKTEALEILEEQLREFIQKIWDSVTEPEVHKGTPLSKFFNVEVVALSCCRRQLKEFKEEVDSLRQRFFHSIAPGGLAGDQRDVVPASGFSVSSQEIWKTIKENKDLDHPAHKVMVATVRCEEIAGEILTSFNKVCPSMAEHATAGRGSGFLINTILNNYLKEYDAEAAYYDDGVKSKKRNQLEDKLLQLIQPAFDSMLGHIRRGNLEKFNEAFSNSLTQGQEFSVAARGCTDSYVAIFDNDCAEDFVFQLANRDPLEVKVAFLRDIDNIKLSKLKTRLDEVLSKRVEALLREADDNTWQAIRTFLSLVTEKAVFDLSLSASVIGFEQETFGHLKNYARCVVEAKAKNEAERVVSVMTKRFRDVFLNDHNSEPRSWSTDVDIKAIANAARLESLKVLSVMAAIRLDGDDDKADNIENTLLRALGNSDTDSRYLLDPSSWEKVSASLTLITPAQCLTFWTEFISETDCHVIQANSAQKSKKKVKTIATAGTVIAATIIAATAAIVAAPAATAIATDVIATVATRSVAMGIRKLVTMATIATAASVIATVTTTPAKAEFV